MAFKRERDNGSHSIKARRNETVGVLSFNRRMAGGEVWPGCGEIALPGVVWETDTAHAFAMIPIKMAHAV